MATEKRGGGYDWQRIPPDREREKGGEATGYLCPPNAPPPSTTFTDTYWPWYEQDKVETTKDRGHSEHAENPTTPVKKMRPPKNPNRGEQ